MKLCKFLALSRAQTAMEYLLILAVVGIIVLSGLRFLLPRVNQSSEGYYNSVTRTILGENPAPINGGWCVPDCPPAGTTGNPLIFKTCECPAPAFGGSYCVTSNQVQDYIYCQGVSDPAVPCTPSGSCSAPSPSCGEITFGQNNCGQACTRQGPSCNQL